MVLQANIYNTLWNCEARQVDYGFTLTGVVAQGQTNANLFYHLNVQNCGVHGYNILVGNGNKFYGVTAEAMDGKSILYCDATGQKVYGYYVESQNATYVEFGPNSLNNTVYDQKEFQSGSSNIDNGTGNLVTLTSDGNRVVIPDGTEASPGLYFKDEPGTGIGRVASTMRILVNTQTVALISGNRFGPVAGIDVDLGVASAPWRHLYLSGNATIPGMPTSDPGIAGRLWNNGGVVNVSAG